MSYNNTFPAFRGTTTASIIIERETGCSAGRRFAFLACWQERTSAERGENDHCEACPLSHTWYVRVGSSAAPAIIFILVGVQLRWGKLDSTRRKGTGRQICLENTGSRTSLQVLIRRSNPSLIVGRLPPGNALDTLTKLGSSGRRNGYNYALSGEAEEGKGLLNSAQLPESMMRARLPFCFARAVTGHRNSCRL